MKGVWRILLIGGLACAALFFVHGVYLQADNIVDIPRLSEARVVVGGDMMFDRSIRTTIDEKGGDYVFSCLDPVLKGADLVMANLEGPITPNASKSVGSSVGGAGNFTFTFPLSTAELLYRHNVRVVNLGNNHILNFNFEGLRATEDALTTAGVAYFGDPVAQSVATVNINDVVLAFINYNDFGLSSSSYRASTTLSQIRAAKKAGALPVVYTHWGIEYVPENDAQIALAHEFVDAGAAIVIGSHPHVVQHHEVYKGAYIYYSLGNMIFDQYWNDAVRSGLLLDITFHKGGVRSVKEVPVYLERDRTTCPKQ
ncbi:MAG: hypothetical protein JWM46_854 [Candidatus Kaiserbacteria bacterium]|nr:hypothetical protein [Candidatus Kaiserbacteria bacterium]